MLDYNQIWQAVLGEIEINLSKANFTTWFRHTFLSSFEDSKIVICVPNTFTKTWLETKYHKQISEALKNTVNESIKEIYYKVETRKNAPLQNFSSNKQKEENEAEIEAAPAEAEKERPQNLNKHGLSTRYVFSTFIVGKSNQLAHAACQAVAANPGNAYNPLFIYGGVGLGKTHLLQAIGHELVKKNFKLKYVTCESFTNDYIQSVKTGQAKDFKDRYRNIDLLLIDDIQFMAGKDGTQEEFFHTFNELHQGNKQIVLTSDRPPKSIPALEKRLISRFEWGMVADIGQPDIETRIAILESKCREKNYTLDAEILLFIANNVLNNIRELEGALNRLIAFHEFNNAKPTLDTTKNLLKSIMASGQSRAVTCKNIIEAVSSFYNINIKDIAGKSRKKELVFPRQITMYLLRKELNTSYPTIGQELGGRDHTTAMHAYQKIEKEMDKEERLQKDIESIRQLLYNAC